MSVRKAALARGLSLFRANGPPRIGSESSLEPSGVRGARERLRGRAKVL